MLSNPQPSGIASLDELLGGGLLLGDNVVWVGESRHELRGAWRAFLAAAGAGPSRYVALGRDPDPDLPAGTRSISVPIPAGPDDAGALAELLTEVEHPEGSRLVVDGLDDLAARWGAPATVAFYRRVCPRLLDLGIIAYWTSSRQMLSQPTIDGIAKIAQCVVEVRDDRLRIVKAEGRPARVQGILVELATDADGTPRLVREHAVGRVGEGLRRIRRERNLTQSQLAALAGVTPAAISQAETGRRGLSLDTLLPLSDALGITLDDIVGSPGTIDAVLVRHDRRTGAAGPTPDPVALFDDPGEAMRAYLVTLGPEEDGTPTFAHKGLEMILVADGLVLIDLGDQTPVMRAGDALMVRRVPIRGWSNLRSEPARLFWVVSG